jgi:hypothetical protein
MDEPNPYGPPTHLERRRPPTPPGEAAQGVFLAWECLRVLYNVIAISVFVGWACYLLGSSENWLPSPLLSFVLLTNLAFCAGPCAEGYLVWLGIRDRRPLRAALFIAGTLVACFLGFVAVVERSSD